MNVALYDSVNRTKPFFTVSVELHPKQIYSNETTENDLTEAVLISHMA